MVKSVTVSISSLKKCKSLVGSYWISRLKIFVSSREAPKVINSYKIIEKTKDNGDKSFYILGKSDLVFPSLSEILKFYSSHYLNQSPLIKPVRI